MTDHLSLTHYCLNLTLTILTSKLVYTSIRRQTK